MQNIAYAAKATTPLHLGLVALREDRIPNMAYSIGFPNHDGMIIWDIVKYDGETSRTSTNIYCLKAGIGFHNDEKRATYNLFYDMKKERTEIAAQSSIVKEFMDGEITLQDSTKVSRYDCILAALDMMYLKGESTQDERMQLLENAGIIDPEGQGDLPDDLIDAVQQAVLWYFTNYGEDKYDLTSKPGWLNYSLTGKEEEFTAVENNDIKNKANLLYNYMISSAKQNANKYANATSSGAPVSIDTNTLQYEESGSNYIVGPIHITEQANNTIPYTINFSVKNGQTAITNYKLLNKDKGQVATGTTVKDLVGDNFYISVPKDSIESISVDFDINYKTTQMTLWLVENSNIDQPVVLPTKKQQSETTKLKVTPDKKIFDLALRKYITKVNGVTLENASSRVPTIDESTLSSGTTATYKHKKDPIVIENGNIVTYKLTIYNEGQKAGRATKVVDQLPTGLKFKRIVSGRFELDSYNENTNKLTLKEHIKQGQETDTDNLSPYTPGNLDSETIEIECEVTATPDVKNSKILTNVAWISEAYDSESDLVITNQNGADRDSEPLTLPTNVNKDNMSNYTGNNNKTDLSDSNYYYKGQQDDDDFEKLVLLPQSFDLKLIKRITAVNNQNVPERIEKVDVSKLNTLDANGNMITTGDYTLNKEPVGVKKGDIVTYTFRIYNEGTIDGYAQEITEDIPEGLQFLWSEKEGEELKNDTTLTAQEKEAIEYNQNRYWVYADNTLKTIKTDYLSKENEKTSNANLIPAFGKNDGTKTEADISYKEVSVKLKVVSENVAGTIIRNEACISEDCDKNGKPVDDRDSDTEDWKKYEDDEDYDNIILQSFDLALRKFIIAVSKDEKIEANEYLKNTDGSYKRAPKVDTSKLNTKDAEGKLITTAIYNHTKEPVAVKKNDIVVYMLRVYNEGDIDGYASEIKDHLPEYLEFVDSDFNKEYGWEVSENGRTVTTRYLENSKINKTTTDSNNKIVLSYKEVPIMCKVKDNAKTNENITNIADISEYLDENKKPVVDRDSQEDNVKLPEDKDLPNYKEDEKGSYIPGQQDDDDFEKVFIKKFDLALRKFITQIQQKEVTTRIPQVKYENGKITYEHDKTPLLVATNNVVTYTIRVYNEGEVAGYATEITDDIPTGLVFLPENDTNKEFRWKMIDKDGEETDDVSKAVKITTDYLSKEQEKEEGDNLLKEFDSSKPISSASEGKEGNPAYRDVQVAFKVTEPNSSDKIIINSAQISEDSDENGEPIDDIDSIPDEWNEGEDDQDREYIKLVEFDLALRKWVTQAIVIENGKQTVTNTGHQPYDDPEQIVKVELHRKKLSNVTVKFRYSIRVINEGEIEGYAKEITDYVPKGLKFVAEDNPGWTDEGNNVISTRLLENKLLKPGEYADVEVVLTWINGDDNMGVMTNTAEISEDDNEYDAPDKDSTPDNKKKGEDDIDDAPVMITVSTGSAKTYFTLGLILLVTVAGGVFLIKKFVL